MTQPMSEVPGVQLEQLALTDRLATYSVLLDGEALGNVEFVKYYEPVLKAVEPYVALWAGPTLCVIDRQQRTMRCFDREDETHGLHPFERLWIVQGELSVELFDPVSGTTLATYGHHEVIIDSSLRDGVVHLIDFNDATVTLDPHRSLQVVASPPIDGTAATGTDQPDAFSGAVFPGWMRVSLTGLALSAAAWVLGALGREALQGNTTPLGIVARMVTAAVQGFGTGFTIFFLLLSAAGVVFWLRDRR
jgi:hypothetical protein